MRCRFSFFQKILCDFRWITSGWSSCSVSCGIGGIRRRSVFCAEAHVPNGSHIENRNVDDHYCWEQKKPSIEEPCSRVECPNWKTGEWEKCSQICENGWQKRIVECRQGDVVVEEILCSQSLRPLDTQKCPSNVNCNDNGMLLQIISFFLLLKLYEFLYVFLFLALVPQNDATHNLDRYR